MKTILSEKESLALRKKLTEAGIEAGHTPENDTYYYPCSCGWKSCLGIDNKKIAFSSWFRHVEKYIAEKHPKLVEEAKDWFGE